MRTIEGTWFSRYEYTSGINANPERSEHQIQVTSTEDGWICKSTQQPDGSEVILELTQNGTEFLGTWREHTAPAGNYKGREFRGLLMLILNSEGTELQGMWLGASRSTGRVKAGEWILRRSED